MSAEIDPVADVLTWKRAVPRPGPASVYPIPYEFQIPTVEGDVFVERKPNGDVWVSRGKHDEGTRIPASVVKLVAWAMLGER